MSQPENPKIIVIKNSFYPSGLTEIDIWNYYQKNKFNILKETKDRNIALSISIDINKMIIRRKGKSGKYIWLTTKNFDNIISGRTITIYSEMKKIEKQAFIDIDVNNFDEAKLAAKRIYEYVLNLGIESKFKKIVSDAKIRYTGKEGFHIVCDLYKISSVDFIRQKFKKILLESPLSRIYTVEYKRKPGIVNLDLSINKFRGLYISEYSLSNIGLKCIEVPYRKILRFSKREAKI